MTIFDAPLIVNDGESADIVIYQELHRFRYGFVWTYRHDIMDHYIARVHNFRLRD
jgi:hypothetical protein